MVISREKVMNLNEFKKFLEQYGIDITRQAIKSEYVTKSYYFGVKEDENRFTKREAQIIAKIRLLKVFLNLKNSEINGCLGIEEESGESDASWSGLFQRDFVSYYEFRKKLIVARLDSERERYGSKWFDKVNWLELYKQYNDHQLLVELALEDIVQKVVNEVYKNNGAMFWQDNAHHLFKLFDCEVNRIIERLTQIIDNQAEEIKALGFVGFADSQKIYPEFIKGKFNADKLYYYELLVEKLLEKIYPPDRMSILNYDEELLGVLFLDQCNDHLLKMVLGDEMVLDWYVEQAASKGGLSKESFLSYINEFRNGISVEKYQHVFNAYLEEHYIKIKTCSVYLLNEYSTGTDKKYTLTTIPVEEIKIIAEQDFGLLPPDFNRKSRP